MTMRVFLVLSVAAALLGSQPAQAQSLCEAPYEVITTLRPARLGVPTVWDAAYGIDGKMVQLESGLPLEGGTVLAVGRTLSQETFAPEKTVLVELNRRGRVMNEKFHPARDAEVPVKMIAVKDGYLVASNIRGGLKKDRRLIRLAWYTKQGAFRKEKLIQDNMYDYDGYGLTAAPEGGGFAVVAHAVNRRMESDQHGMLFRFAAGGEPLWQRAYRPGIPNQIHGAVPLGDNSYLATGRIRIDDNRMAGWVMKLGHDGTVLWQRIYPRGAFAVFRAGAPAGAAEGAGYILMGDATPLDGGPNALWLMAIDQLGEPRWQHYYRRPDMEFSTAGLMRLDDGRMVAALNARALEGSGQRDHVRMLILSPRGAIVEDEAYIEGVRAQANDFVRGWNGERIVISTIESDSKPLDIAMIGDKFVVAEDEPAPGSTEEAMGPPVKEDMPPPEKEKPVLKGWVFVATALDPWDDPCAGRRASQ